MTSGRLMRLFLTWINLSPIIDKKYHLTLYQARGDVSMLVKWDPDVNIHINSGIPFRGTKSALDVY